MFDGVIDEESSIFCVQDRRQNHYIRSRIFKYGVCNNGGPMSESLGTPPNQITK